MCWVCGLPLVWSSNACRMQLYWSFLFTGILSTMGNACFGCYFWFSSLTGLAGDHCRTFILFPDSIASLSHWKELFEDSEVHVSFNWFLEVISLLAVWDINYSHCSIFFYYMHSNWTLLFSPFVRWWSKTDIRLEIWFLIKNGKKNCNRWPEADDPHYLLPFMLLQYFLDLLYRHKLVQRWRLEAPASGRTQPERNTGVAFRGRSYRLSDWLFAPCT